MLAWRDLDDSEAGGSERHAHEILSRWAAMGLDVTLFTSAAADLPAHTERSGYQVVRAGGRMSVFARQIGVRLAGGHPGADAVVDIWNGVPWCSPTWGRPLRRVTWLHHIHGPMWNQLFPQPVARLGRWMESEAAPRLYRDERIITLADSSRAELEAHGFRDVHVVPPGVDPRCSPGGQRSVEPLIVAVGRLAPVKQFDVLIDAFALVAREMPNARLAIVGAGQQRLDLQDRVDHLGLHARVNFVGQVSPDELVAWYRRAWVLASTSLAEGWGMTITEAAACATPAVVTDIVGHRDAVGDAGVLVNPAGGLRPFADALCALLRDPARRQHLGELGQRRVASLSWDAGAAEHLRLLTNS